MCFAFQAEVEQIEGAEEFQRIGKSEKCFRFHIVGYDQCPEV